MGTRKRRQRQEELWVSHAELPAGPGHPFYARLNELLDREKFDEFAEAKCSRFYADNNGRPSLPPGTYFRLLLIGYFEGIDSERGIAWRADSLGLRRFLRIGLDEDTPDHSTISRARRLIDVETHRKMFLWVLGVLADRGLLELKKPSEYPIPEELQRRLDDNAVLSAAFATLTPGRRKSYLFHVSSAKQTQTRAARAEKCVPMILSGRGFNEFPR